MTDWYRNTDWTDAIEAQFFAKLAKARSQRDQYIVLQAHHLAQSHPQAALSLIDLYFETRSEDFHDARADRVRAAAQFAAGGFVGALDNYLKLLNRQEATEDLYVGSPLEFAFLAARFRSASHYDAALEQLAAVEQPSEHQVEPRFRYCAARALILAENGGDPATALAMARTALALPQVVVEHYSDVSWRLRGLTRK